MNNLYQNLPSHLPEECFDVLFSQPNIRIERIISQGHTTPDGQWYDQAEDEWVLVLQGLGIIEYEDGRQMTLRKGDYLYIPAHVKHRVVLTSEQELTIWLAIHFANATHFGLVRKC